MILVIAKTVKKMANDLVMASSLLNSAHLAALLQLWRNRLNKINLQYTLVGVIDTAPEAILDVLAIDYDILGYNGWFLADTVAKKRSLLKRAYYLKRIAGTPAGIREAAKALGIQGVIRIEEGVGGVKYDGAHKYDGSVKYGGANWAKFKVTFDASLNPGLSAQKIDDFKNMVEQYKRASTTLTGVYVV